MAKYRDLQDLKKLKPRAIASNTWYKIYRGWELVKSGLKQKVGNGDLIHFWLDTWIGDDPLINQCINPPLNQWLLKPICAYLEDDRSMKLEGLEGFLERDVLQAIERITMGCRTKIHGPVRLLLQIFSFQPLLEHLYRTHLPQLPKRGGERCRNLKGLLDKSMTLWLLKHERLPTTNSLWKKNIITNPLCFHCKIATKNLKHVMRDYPKARGVWHLPSNGANIPGFQDTVKVGDWIQLNLS